MNTREFVRALQRNDGFASRPYYVLVSEGRELTSHGHWSDLGQAKAEYNKVKSSGASESKGLRIMDKNTGDAVYP